MIPTRSLPNCHEATVVELDLFEKLGNDNQICDAYKLKTKNCLWSCEREMVSLITASSYMRKKQIENGLYFRFQTWATKVAPIRKFF